MSSVTILKHGYHNACAMLYIWFELDTETKVRVLSWSLNYNTTDGVHLGPSNPLPFEGHFGESVECCALAEVCTLLSALLVFFCHKDNVCN